LARKVSRCKENPTASEYEPRWISDVADLTQGISGSVSFLQPVAWRGWFRQQVRSTETGT
jgi:hypothetical protein